VRVVEIYQYRGTGQKVIGFSAFIVMVINCTAGMEWKSQKMEVVVAAAERYLGDLTSEELQGVLSGGVPSFQDDDMRWE
jgi:hypothetical protein